MQQHLIEVHKWTGFPLKGEDRNQDFTDLIYQKVKIYLASFSVSNNNVDSITRYRNGHVTYIAAWRLSCSISTFYHCLAFLYHWVQNLMLYLHTN